MCTRPRAIPHCPLAGPPSHDRWPLSRGGEPYGGVYQQPRHAARVAVDPRYNPWGLPDSGRQRRPQASTGVRRHSQAFTGIHGHHSRDPPPNGDAAAKRCDGWPWRQPPQAHCCAAVWLCGLGPANSRVLGVAVAVDVTVDPRPSEPPGSGGNWPKDATAPMARGPSPTDPGCGDAGFGGRRAVAVGGRGWLSWPWGRDAGRKRSQLTGGIGADETTAG